MAYRLYTSSCMQQISGMKISYYELINKKSGPVDNRTGDEIALDVIKKCGLKFKNEGCE